MAPLAGATHGNGPHDGIRDRFAALRATVVDVKRSKTTLQAPHEKSTSHKGSESTMNLIGLEVKLQSSFSIIFPLGENLPDQAHPPGEFRVETKSQMHGPTGVAAGGFHIARIEENQRQIVVNVSPIGGSPERRPELRGGPLEFVFFDVQVAQPETRLDEPGIKGNRLF